MGAMRRRRTDEFYALIAAGDDDGVREMLAREPDLARSCGSTPPPLHWAIYHNRSGIAELLLNAGADLGLRDQDRMATPVEYATVYARRQIIRLLVARGADAERGLEVALKGAAGGFEEFPELPSRAVYGAVVALLSELRATPSPPEDRGTNR